MNEFRTRPLIRVLAFTALVSVSAVGCMDPVPPIDMPASTPGDAEVYRFNSETNQVDHVTMAVADAVQTKDKTVVLDFSARWCGPCKMLVSEMEKVAETLDSSVVIVKVDVDEHPELAQHFQVSSIPDVRFFKEGKVIGGFRGYKTADKIVPMLQD